MMPKISVGACCVRGASHIQKNTPCQDSAGFIKSPDGKSIGIAVSDGHGYVRHFRSQKGSEFAKEIALSVIEEVVQVWPVEMSRKQLEGNIKQVEKAVLSRWLQKVKEDVDSNPFTEEELQKFPEEERDEIVQELYKAYGATLIAVFLWDKYCIGFHIGDGNCILVQGNDIIREPIPEDETCGFDKTSSLSERKAFDKFRECIEPLEGLKGIVISTDGLRKSGALDWFEEVCRAVVNDYACEAGSTDEEMSSLEELLNGISQGGSGDDISVAYIAWQEQVR